MKRRISAPMQRLVEQSGLEPSAFNDAIDEQVGRRGSTILHRSHPLVEQVRATTGINLVQIARRSLHLLIEIEQPGENGLLWTYRERTPRTCIFSFAGTLSETIGSAAKGKRLDQLVSAPSIMADLTIEELVGSSDGWLHVAVQPEWHTF